jgi:CRP-like cAMP-binding protein
MRPIYAPFDSALPVFWLTCCHVALFQAHHKVEKVLAMRIAEDVLETVDLFKTLDRHSQHLVAKNMQLRFHADGEDIVLQGTTGEEFFILVQGQCVTKVDGRAVLRDALAKPGYSFGSIALFTEAMRTATVTALGPSVTLVLSRRHLLDMEAHFAHVPGFSEAFKEVQQTAVDLVQRTLTENVTLSSTHIVPPASLTRSPTGIPDATGPEARDFDRSASGMALHEHPKLMVSGSSKVANEVRLIS